MSERRDGHWRTWAVAVLLLGACGPRVATAPIEDELGRQCLLTCPAGERICDIGCDVEPGAPPDCLERGGEPGYWVAADVLPDSRPLYLCEACFFPFDDYPVYPLSGCARLVCDEPKDCGYTETLCVDGLCQERPLD